MKRGSSAAAIGSMGAIIALAACLLAVPATADDKPGSTLKPSGLPNPGDVAKKIDYGFCSGPQNAHTYAPSPVKITLGKCNDMSQSFSAVSDGPSVGHNCGGFSMAFGPKGNLNPKLHQITMVADWGDAPLNAQNCSKAKITTQAYGERCLTDACDKTTWDVIGPKQNGGDWDGRTCQLATKLTSTGKPYRTLNLDIIATLTVNNAPVRKRAKGTITAELKQPDCYDAGEGKVATKR